MSYKSESRQSYTQEQIATRNTWLQTVWSLDSDKFRWPLKGTVYGISKELVRLGVPHTGLGKVWIPAIMEHTGSKERTTKGHLSELESIGALIKVTIPVKNQKGETVNRVHLGFSSSFYPVPILADTLKGTNRGKTQKKHKGCGGTIVNLCTACGEVDVPEDDVYYELVDQGGDIERNTEELARLDAQVAAFEKYGGADAEEIPDSLIDEFGSTEAVLSATPIDIARVMDEREQFAEEASEYTKGWYHVEQ